MIPTITKENLPEIRELLQHTVCETFPNVTCFITKADVGDRIPEGFDLDDMGREVASSWAWRAAERSPKRRDGRRSREASR